MSVKRTAIAQHKILRLQLLFSLEIEDRFASVTVLRVLWTHCSLVGYPTGIYAYLPYNRYVDRNYSKVGTALAGWDGSPAAFSPAQLITSE